LEKKLSSRVEEIQPSAWFNMKYAQWQKASGAWNAKLKEYKAVVQKKATDKAQKAKAAAAKEAAAKAKAEKAVAEGKEPEPADEKMEEAEEEEEDVAVDFEGIDVFGVDDVMDLGGGMPLFKDFLSEDWALLSLRFELHLLVHAFKHDVADDERPGIPVNDLAFYYNKYYKKPLAQASYGVESLADVVNLVHDTTRITAKTKVLDSQLDAEMESLQIFVKLTEEARRDRNLRIDLGEESAKLKISLAVDQQAGWKESGWKAGGQAGGWKGQKAPKAAGYYAPFAAGWKQQETQGWKQQETKQEAKWRQPGKQ